MKYLKQLSINISKCKNCDKSETWCEYHKKISRKLSALSVKLSAYIRRNEDIDAIDEITQQMEEILNNQTKNIHNIKEEKEIIRSRE